MLEEANSLKINKTIVADLNADVENEKRLISEKEQFEVKWKNGITPEQMKENLHKRIEKLFADKK